MFLIQNIQDRFWIGVVMMGIALVFCGGSWWALFEDWRERRR